MLVWRGGFDEIKYAGSETVTFTINWEESTHTTKILTTVLITAIVQCAAARDFKVEAGQSIQVAACCGVRPRTRLRIGA